MAFGFGFKLGFTVSVIASAISGALFSLSNKTSIIPEIGSHSSFTSGAGVIKNSDGFYQALPTNCAKFEGARYVDNQLRLKGATFNSEDLTIAIMWSILGSATIDNATTVSFSTTSDAIYLNAITTEDGEYVLSITLSGSGTTIIQMQDTVKHSYTVTLSATPTRYYIAGSLVSGTNKSVWLARNKLNEAVAGTATEVTVHNIQWENKSSYNVTDKVIPSEYVSLGVESAPYYNTGADGTKSFDVELANTVLNNIVTEGVGTDLTSLKGQLYEPAATNLFLNSFVPVTQNITTTAITYTLSIEGAGDITLSGTATGTATDGSPLTVIATAGTLTLTVNGVVTKVNLEATNYSTSFIETFGSSVTRTKSLHQSVWPETVVNNFKIKFTYLHKAQMSGNGYIIGIGSGTDYISMYVFYITEKLVLNTTVSGVNLSAAADISFVEGTVYDIEVHNNLGVLTFLIDTVEQTANNNHGSDFEWTDPETLYLGTDHFGNFSQPCNITNVVVEIL